MSRKNLIVGQSGGPTAVINSSLYGVVSEGIKQEEIEHVYGMINGIEGFLKGTILDFEEALPGEKPSPSAYIPIWIATTLSTLETHPWKELRSFF